MRRDWKLSSIQYIVLHSKMCKVIDKLIEDIRNQRNKTRDLLTKYFMTCNTYLKSSEIGRIMLLIDFNDYYDEKIIRLNPYSIDEREYECLVDKIKWNVLGIE